MPLKIGAEFIRANCINGLPGDLNDTPMRNWGMDKTLNVRLSSSINPLRPNNDLSQTSQSNIKSL